jgi:hypothetical protein
MSETTGIILSIIGIVALFLYALHARKEQRRLNQEVKDAWNAIPDDAKEQLIGLIPTLLPIQKLVTCSHCVVVYQPAGLHGLKHEIVEQKIRAIMDASPNADLAKYEAALGVKIIDVDRKKPPYPDSIRL